MNSFQAKVVLHVSEKVEEQMEISKKVGKEREMVVKMISFGPHSYDIYISERIFRIDLPQTNLPFMLFLIFSIINMVVSIKFLGKKR